MARETQKRITQAPQLDSRRPQQELTQVTARSVNTYAGGYGGGNDELDGLVSGLASFNPQLSKYLETKESKDIDDARLTAMVQAEGATIDPAQASTLPESMPDSIDPAYRPHFDKAYKDVLGARIGIETASTLAEEYQKKRNDPDFNPDVFLAEKQAELTGGISDPTIKAQVVQSNILTARKIREEHRKFQHEQLKTSSLSNLDVSAMDVIKKSNDDPEILQENINELVTSKKPLWSQYMTRSEFNERLLHQVVNNIKNSGGHPRLLDVFDKHKDPVTGLTMAEANPELGLKLAQERKTIEAEHNAKITRDAQPELFKQKTSWLESIAETGNLIPHEVLTQNIGPGKVFSTFNEAVAFDQKQRSMIETKDDSDAILEMFKNGNADILDEKKQKIGSDLLTKEAVQALLVVVNDPTKQQDIEDVTRALINVHTSGGATVPNEIAVRMIERLGTTPADPSGPPARFQALVEVYKSLGQDTNVRDMYFKGDSKDLVENYIRETENKVDPVSAYKTAYSSISPEAKERAQLITSSPGWQAKQIERFNDGVDRLNVGWRDIFPGVSDLPRNTGIGNSAALIEMKRFTQAHPEADDDRLDAHMKKWAALNFIHDAETNSLIGVPPGRGQGAKEVISYSLEKIREKYPDGAATTMIHMGNGVYRIQNTRTHQVHGDVKFADLLKEYGRSKTLTPEDRNLINLINQKSKDGSLSLTDMETIRPLQSKLRVLDMEDALPTKALKNVREQAFKNAFEQIPQIDLGPGSTVLAPVIRKDNDKSTQKQITTRFLNRRDGNSLTGALITQGEGVVLRASPDPARGAGLNIGMGYNLKANEANMKEDFRRAGIPVEHIEGIKAGRVAITPEQAERLLMVVTPRYTKIAKDAIEGRHKGLWDRLTPEQKAVITDVAYQTGNVKQFGESIDAFFSGDPEKMKNAFKVHYKDSKTGKMVEDKRRNDLRANLLRSKYNFRAITAND